MFGLFRSNPFSDPVLGELVRSRGLWRGTLAIGRQSVPVALTGTRVAPDRDAVTVARDLPSVWSGSQAPVARALIEHLEPYREAVMAGEAAPPNAPFPVIVEPEDVWQSVSVRSVSVVRIGGKLIAEVALCATWDEEHTLGARFDEGRLVELNGSILEP